MTAPLPGSPDAVRVFTLRLPSQFQHAMAIRTAVFVLEQHVPADQEADALDAEAIHALVEWEGQPVATGRLILPDATHPYGKVGRMAVLAPFRGRHLGTLVMDHLTHEARARGVTELRLSAQEHAVPFYQRLGYQVFGACFMECNIPHVWMKRSLVP